MAAVLASGMLRAQTTPAMPVTVPAGNTAVPTLRAQARLVVVDVVVRDRSHSAIHDLKQSDFTLLEEGKPQNVRFFTEHRAATGRAAMDEPAPKLPPGFFTNFSPAPASSAVNVLLIDSLNTPQTDQIYLRQQLVEYLKHEPAGTNVAIFGLNSRLSLLQSFTTDPELLRTFFLKEPSKYSPLLADPNGNGGAGLDSGTADQLASLGITLPGDLGASVQAFQNETEYSQTGNRITMTLQAMNELGRYLANIPGRKNLLWFSGAFPLDLLPANSGGSTFGSDPFASAGAFEYEYRETTNLLARSQVAVYPIDARGYQTSPAFEAANSSAMTGAAARRQDDQFYQNNEQEHLTMSRMAEDTGGRAFYNTNGLAAAAATAIQEGADYYSLSYSPSDQDWRGNFRKIEVKLAERGYTLAYRRGYYADDPNSSGSAFTHDGPKPVAPGQPAQHDSGPMQHAMMHGSPAPTQILFKVRVLPASAEPEDKLADGNKANLARLKGPYRRLAIDYAVVPADVQFTSTADDLHTAGLEFVTLVYSADGALVNSSVNAIHANLPRTQYERLVHASIPFHQEVSVPEKGVYSLRIGIRDLNTNHIGSLELPVSSVRELAPLPDATAATPPPVAH